MECSPPGSSCPWGFSRQEYWTGLPCLPPGDLPNPEIETESPVLRADSSPAELPGKPLVKLNVRYLGHGWTNYMNQKYGILCSY